MKTLLADLGFERNADSIRGFVVQAWLIGLLAVVASWSVIKSFQQRSAVIASTDSEWRGAPFMKHTFSVVLKLAVGVGLVAGGARVTRLITSPQFPALVITPPSEATKLALGSDSVLHVGARSGYFTIDRVGKKTVSSGAESRDLRHTAGLLVQGDDLWIASEQGLFRKHGKNLEAIKARDDSDLGPVFCLLHTRNGRLLAGGVSRLLRQSDDGAWEAQNGIALDRISVLYEDRKGRLWAGCDTPNSGGLLCLDQGSTTFVDMAKGLPHRSVCDLAEDAEGILWVATGFAAFGGVAHWNEATQTWLPLDGPPGLEGRKIRSLFLDSIGAFWFCSEYDGIVIKKGKGWHPFLYRQGFPCREVKNALEADGGVWLASERGVIFLNKHPLADFTPTQNNATP